MRALVIAPQPFFTPRGTPFSVYYRTLVTAQLGVAIDLLTYGVGQDVDIPGVRIVRIPRFGVRAPVKIGPSFLKLALDCVMVAWTAALLLRRRYDFVHAHEEAVFWCRFLKPLFRFTLVYDMHSSLPQQLSNFQFTRSRVLIAVFRWLERTALRSADAVVTICPDLEDRVLAAGVDASRQLLIENSLFEEVRLNGHQRVSPQVSAEGDALLDAVLASGRPFILYAGTFEIYQGLDLLLHAFAAVLEKRPDVRLFMVGGTRAQIDQTCRLAQSLGIGDACVLTGPVSKTRVTELTHRAHVLVSPRTGGTNTPLKIYEQLASGRPLVATRVWSHTQVLTDDVCILVDPKPAAMADGILRALDAGAPAVQGVNARALYERRYSRAAYESKIRRLLDVVCVH
jgi:glycosyltransferase involved in cell wall biosynthesis